MNDIQIDLKLKKELLEKQGCFSQFSEEETEKLANLLMVMEFKAGDTIVVEGDLVDSIYLIITGTADVRHVYIINHQTQVNHVATLGPGESIGLNEAGFYSLDGRRTATVIANTDMVTLYLSVAEFHGFSLVHPHVNEVMRKNAQAFLHMNI